MFQSRVEGLAAAGAGAAGTELDEEEEESLFNDPLRFK